MVKSDTNEQLIAQSSVSSGEIDEVQCRLLDALPVMTCLASVRGVAVYFNRSAREKLGIADALDLEAVLTAFHPDDFADMESQWEQAVDLARPMTIQLRLRMPEGFRWHQIDAHPVHDAFSDAHTHWLATAIDIDAQRAREDDKQTLLRSAQEANRLKDEFLATLSHELRTPLNAMLGWAQMLQRGLDPTKTSRALEAIERNALAQAKLVDDLLDISRIASGKLVLERSTIRLREIVDAAIDTLRPTLDAKRIQLTLSDDAPTAWVEADARRIQQVLWNLLSNAAKFTSDSGHVLIRINSEGGRAEVTISDNGRGISPTMVNDLFRPFRQGNQSTTRTHGGLGLGLAISREIVALHGGEIRGTSEGISRGSTFSVMLPTSDVRPANLSGDGVRGLRILVVEDEADARELLSTLLRTWGVSVLAVDSADAALAAVVGQKFDLMLSDIGMPFKDGYSLIREIRRLPGSAQLPAAAVTAFVSARDRQQALDAGFQVHLSKPIDPTELRAVIERLARASVALVSATDGHHT